VRARDPDQSCPGRAITFATNHLSLDLLSGVPLFHLARLESAVLQGFVGTFVFY
jgi:hypothetical protein